MKKKLEKHAIDIATSKGSGNIRGVYQFIRDTDYYFTDGHRILQTDTKVDEIEGNAHADKLLMTIENAFKSVYSLDYILHDLPTVAELKVGIKTTGSRNRVIWSDGKVTINARYLVEAMEALSATKCYVAKGNEYTMPILFVEDDNPQSLNRELIFGVVNKDERKGFWSAND